MSSTYQPSNVPGDFTPAQRLWIEREFAAIKAAEETARPSLRMVVTTIEPARYADGDIYEAASPWNPGAGDGLYIRRAGAWVKLG